MDNYYNNNYVKVIGKIDNKIETSHISFKENFYKLSLRIPRLSKTYDFLPVVLSERLIDINSVNYDNSIVVEGQYRSYNNSSNTGNKLILVIFAKDIKILSENEQIQNPNYIKLSGYICKKPIYRETPFGREICDMLLAVNRQYKKSDYIPCIAWGRNAKYISKLNVGEHVRISGRIQSREYEKKLTDESTINKIAYEVSISRVEIVTDENT